MKDRSTDRIALALVRRGADWLVQRRCSTDGLAGLWEFPGGKIEAGETAMQAAVRECAEETGLTVEALREMAGVEHQYDFGRVVLHPVLCRLLQDRPADCQTSLGEVQWVTPDTLARLPMPAGNQSLVAALFRLDAHHDDLPVT